jgi:translation initiation factor IF-1
MTLPTRIIRNSQIRKSSVSVSPVLYYIKVWINAEDIVKFLLHPSIKKTSSTVLKYVKISLGHHITILCSQFQQNRLWNKKFWVHFNLGPRNINFTVQTSRTWSMWVSFSKNSYKEFHANSDKHIINSM